MNPRPTGRQQVQEWSIQPGNRLGSHTHLDLDPRRFQDRQAAAISMRRWVAESDHHASHSRCQNRVGAGRSLTVMTARFQGHEQGRTASRLASRFQRRHLGMTATKFRVPSLTQDPQVAVHNHRTHRRVRLDTTLATSRQAHGVIHHRLESRKRLGHDAVPVPNWNWSRRLVLARLAG